MTLWWGQCIRSFLHIFAMVSLLFFPNPFLLPVLPPCCQILFALDNVHVQIGDNVGVRQDQSLNVLDFGGMLKSKYSFSRRYEDNS